MAPFGKVRVHDGGVAFQSASSCPAQRGDTSLVCAQSESSGTNLTYSSGNRVSSGTHVPKHHGASEPSPHDNVYGDEFRASFLEMVDLEVVEHDSRAARVRSRLAHIIMNQKFEMCVGIVIISNFVVIALETDVRARQDKSRSNGSETEASESILLFISIINLIYLLLYTIESSVRMYVFRCDFFNHMWNNFDLVIVATGALAEILDAISRQSAGVAGLDGLRTLRTIRMLRATRILVSFDELYALVSGLTNAMKTLMWAGILMLMVLTMWSIVAVEYIKPLMPGINNVNGFGTCSWCPSAFDNVLLSNLTFFQIISGDGWSHVARPLIEEHGWTALLFVAVIFSMVFGLLNLVVAVMVDSAHQAREADIMNMAAKKDAARAAAWDCFSDMVGELDENGDGEISVEELKTGLLNRHDLLSAYLTIMGIEMSDLEMVFELLDADGDGTVTHEEFTHQLYQMKTQELPITLCYVKAGVSKVQHDLEKMSAEIQSKLVQMMQHCSQDVNMARDSPEDSRDVPKSPSNKFLEPCDSGNGTPRVSSGKRKTNPGRGRRVSLFQGKPPPTLRSGTAKDLGKDLPAKSDEDEAGGPGTRKRSLFGSKQPPALRIPSIPKILSKKGDKDKVDMPATKVGKNSGSSGTNSFQVW